MVPGSTLMYGSNFCSVTLYPWPSSRQPIDAAARPLPSEDTTPPVTKIYLVVRPSIWLMVLSLSPLTRRGRRQKATHVFKILGRVDANRIVRRFNRLDPDAVFERAQLLQGLGALERRGFEGGQHQEGAPAKRVQADMSIERGPPAARVAQARNGRA